MSVILENRTLLKETHQREKEHCSQGSLKVKQYFMLGLQQYSIGRVRMLMENGMYRCVTGTMVVF